MGEEIQYRHFKQADYHRFNRCLVEETGLLHELFAENALSSHAEVAGCELEAWLIDAQQTPCPDNGLLLKYADNPLLSPELARFNFELNVEPLNLSGSVLSRFDERLQQLWRDCSEQAARFDNEILAIGILPTLASTDLTLANISPLERYRALNEQVLRLREGASIELNLSGEEHLHSRHSDVMLEAATTSLQIHIQVPQHQAVRYYNAAIAVSAAMAGISANSPFLFARKLWQETRIPVFEQSVPAGGFGAAAHGPVHRVGFGMGFARESLAECFDENLQHFPILLPVQYAAAPAEFRHLRLHNGTIWRWNRPLIGFDEDGKTHIRIEHRVCAAAPSMADNIANMAFFYGLVHYYASLAEPPETELRFSQCRDDFYAVARHGMLTAVDWCGGYHGRLQRLILERLLPESASGLHSLGINQQDSKRYLDIIDRRVSSAQTGSAWQLAFTEAHGRDMALLTRSYLANQQTGRPVHEWDLVSCERR